MNIKIKNICEQNFSLYGDLITIKDKISEDINNNTTQSFFDLANIEILGKDSKVRLNIFKAKERNFPLNIDKLDMDKNYLVFSGIGSPDSFINTLKKYKFKIVKNLEFPDHYNYSDLEIMSIKKTAKIYNADIITTEKDYIRLSKLNSQDINFLEIELKIKNEKKLIDFLNTRI